MKPVLFAVVIASQLTAFAFPQTAQKRRKPKAKTEITYQANKLGGYNFMQDGRRIAYSKPETEGDWTTQILYVCPNARDKRAPKKDTPVIKVTPKEIVPIEGERTLFMLYSVALGELWVPGNHVEDRFAIVLREKPDPDVKKRRALPVAPERSAVTPTDLSKVGNISVERREITIKTTGRTVKYFANKVGGYTFAHEGKILLYSKAYDGPGMENPMQFGSQSVWMRRPHDEDLPVATLWRSSEKDPFKYSVGRSIVDGVDIEDVLRAIQPVLEQPNPMQVEKTTGDHWRELLGKP
jgi:hypothetical protein